MNKVITKSVIPLIFFLSFSSLLWGQDLTKVTGTVTDAKTGDPLPFVDVYFVGTYTGVNTNIDGLYSIEIEEEVDSIAFTYLGYARKMVPIEQGKTQEINITLAESKVELKTATVIRKRRKRKKDTAAIALWRNVVKHWPQNSIESADNYYYKDYTKVGFDWFKPGKKLLGNKLFKKNLKIMMDYVRMEENGDKYLPFLHKETIKEYAYQQKPKDQVEKTLADRFSGIENESISDFVGDELNKVDPFKTVNVIVGKSFIGPFAPTSNVQYNYFLTDSLERNGDKYYELTFVGRRKQDLTFLGFAWVHKPTYAISSIEMEISPHIGLNHIQTMDIVQYYTQLPSGKWFAERETMVAKAKLDFIDIGTRKNRNKKNQIRIRKEVKRYDLAVNTDIDKELLKGEAVKWAEKSTERAPDYWQENRPEPLDSVSAGVYTMMDSIQNTFFYKFMDFLGYAAMTSYFRAGPIEFGEFPEFVSYNKTEGVRIKLGVRTSKKLSDKFQLSTYAAYGFRDKKWKYGFTGKFHLPSKNRRWNMLKVWYKNDFQMLAQQDEMLTSDNIVTTITRLGAVDNLMMIREAGISYERDWVRGFYTRIGYQWRRFYSVDGGFQFTTGDGQVPIPTYTSSEIKVRLHGGFKERFMTHFTGFKRNSLDALHPIFTLDYTGGIKGFLGGQHNYHKFELNMRHRVNSPIGYTRYQLHAGKTFGNAPYPVLTVHLGNQSIIRNGWAYAMMNEFEFVSDTYGAVWMDHHFDGLILNTIPFLNKLKWRTILMFKGLYGTVKQSNLDIIDMPAGISQPGFYAEIGFGIENIFKMIRIDFMWRMTQLGQPNVRPFGINLVVNPKF